MNIPFNHPSPYSNTPLSENQTRLFRLQKDNTGLISIQLQRFSLNDDDCPRFVATSYVWGDQSETATIHLNGHKTQVLRSAHVFFEAMLSDDHCHQFPSSTTWWWMDCICINQDNPAERSVQVGLMSAIYRKSAQTAIWLGEKSQDSDVGMSFLERLNQAHTAPPTERGREPAGITPTESHILHDLIGWKAAENLLKRKWWGRVWTLQEFLMGKNAVFFCGSKRMKLSRMAYAIHGIWYWNQFNSGIIPRQIFEKAWNRIRLLDWHMYHAHHQSHLPMVGIMTYTATSSVTDPRDRLYSLLGLVSPGELEVIGRPDYESDPSVVYTKFAVSFIKKYQSLDLVCIAPEMRQRVRSGDEKERLMVPSWIPDWSLRREHSPPVMCMASQSGSPHIGNFRPLHSVHSSAAYRASASDLPVVSFSDDLKELTCTGIQLDEIDGLSGGDFVQDGSVDLVQSTSCINNPEENPASLSKDRESFSRSSTIIAEVSRCLTLDRHDPYLGHPAPRYEFARQFLRVGKMAITTQDQISTPALQWINHNKNLRLRGWTLEQAIGKTTTPKFPFSLRPNPESSPPWGGQNSNVFGGSDGSGNWTSFVSRFRDTTFYRGKRLMVTRSRILGMAPRVARKWDVVCVLIGCSIPVVLRPVVGTGKFKVVGECYVDGYMNGEAVGEVKGAMRKVVDIKLV